MQLFDTREQAALEAYLRLLERKGADQGSLDHRRAQASRLLPSLSMLPQKNDRYRECVECIVQNIDRAEWPAFLAFAREYYHFWVNDIKAIAAMLSHGDFETTPIQTAAIEGTLETLWKSVESEKFSTSETWPLKAYVAALRGDGADKALVETRSRLVRLLLVRLRGLEDPSPRQYRGVVDAMLPLFEKPAARRLFLVVVQEFFHFWVGNPDASSHIVLDDTATL